MQKKLTITIDEDVYEGLYRVVGSGHISAFIEALVRPHVLYPDLEAEYREMANEEERESEAQAWAEGTVGDVGDEPW
jgi:predicted CopG family antitoxin